MTLLTLPFDSFTIWNLRWYSGTINVGTSQPEKALNVDSGLPHPWWFCRFDMRCFMELVTAPNPLNVTELVSQAWRMWYECVTCPMAHVP